jgi:integrase
MSVRTPKYRLHKASGQALVQLDGRRIYLGKYGTPESKERYRRLVTKWLSQTSDKASKPYPVHRELSVSELLAEYVRHAKSYYVKNGELTDEIYGIRAAFRPLRELFGHTMAETFGPKDLKLVRQRMIDSGHSRRYINDNVNRICRAFKWAVENELIPVTTYQALVTVSGLRRGRSEAKETRPVQPVSPATVEATLKHLSPVVADMVRLQQFTGCRPGEVCAIRPCDVDCADDEVWTYVPMAHKTEHYGRERSIFLGPRAQGILRPYLLRAATDFCFSPAESEAKRSAGRRDRRESSMTPSQQRRRGKSHRSRAPGNRYTKDSYRQAIQRACDKAFPAPEDLDDDAVKAWQSDHRWSPNQLRHTAATDIRKEFGLEASQTVLGHSSADVTQIYAERDYAKAREIMKNVG